MRPRIGEMSVTAQAHDFTWTRGTAATLVVFALAVTLWLFSEPVAKHVGIAFPDLVETILDRATLHVRETSRGGAR